MKFILTKESYLDAISGCISNIYDKRSDYLAKATSYKFKHGLKF